VGIVCAVICDAYMLLKWKVSEALLRYLLSWSPQLLPLHMEWISSSLEWHPQGHIYDSLTEDFSYALLLITIVALIAAIFVTWILSERKELQEKWR
jgi:hypothetical protein